MRDFQHSSQHGERGERHGKSYIEAHVESHVRSPFSVGRVDANPFLGRDSMVGSRRTRDHVATAASSSTSTSTSTKASTEAAWRKKTWEGDSNTENEVASA